MLYKIITLFVVFTFEFFLENVFAATIFISPEDVTIKNESFSRWTFSNNANIKKAQSCTREEISVKCGILELIIEPTAIYAEIYLNYDNITNSNSIQLNINFREKDIVVTKKKELNYFSYDEEGIHNLESHMRRLHHKIIFNIVRIFNSNPESNYHSLNSTIYDKKLKTQLENVQNSSLWDYVKEDLVKMKNYNNQLVFTTLKDIINNSTILKITVEEILHETITITINRTIRYVLLLAVYTYKILEIDGFFKSDPFWNELIEYFTKLNVAKIKLTKHSSTTRLIEQLKTEQSFGIEVHILKYLIEVCTLTLYPSDKIIEHNFEKAKISKSEKSNTHILEEQVLNYLLKEFYKEYNFNLIPDTIDELKKKLKIIFRLIDAEYTNILEIDF